MLDNLLNSVKRATEKVQRRGEEVAQVARLRMEIFGLNRELDGAYARLGRAYHSGSDVDLLQGVRDDIARVEEEIVARERLITELGGDPREGVDEQTVAPTPGSVSLSKQGLSLESREEVTRGPSTSDTILDNRPNFSSGPNLSGSTEPTIPDAMPRSDQDPDQDR
ncbi:hypothetical protein ACFSR9_02020 [Deinococcus taklimakanensis]|uniref:Uncharacterized protein n=1 Tax=Deinococcus taklimakanensis TaxID=536443 RepID=A0ABW5P279_9DEIO